MIATVEKEASTPHQDDRRLTVAAEPERVRKIIHVDMDAFSPPWSSATIPLCGVDR